MSSVPELYAAFLFDQYHFRATFPPGLRLALGDVGFLEDGVFDRYTNLHALGVTFEKAEEFGRSRARDARLVRRGGSANQGGRSTSCRVQCPASRRRGPREPLSRSAGLCCFLTRNEPLVDSGSSCASARDS